MEWSYYIAENVYGSHELLKEVKYRFYPLIFDEKIVYEYNFLWMYFLHSVNKIFYLLVCIFKNFNSHDLLNKDIKHKFYHF